MSLNIVRSIAGLILLIVLCLLSYSRSSVYIDDVVLMSDTVNKSQNKARPHYNLGRALISARRPQEAVFPLERALQIQPRDVLTLHSLAIAYYDIGATAESERCLVSIIEHHPYTKEARFARSMLDMIRAARQQ